VSVRGGGGGGGEGGRLHPGVLAWPCSGQCTRNTQRHTPTRTHSHSCTHMQPFTRLCMHEQSHSHTHTHAHIHTHTLSHTHIHTQTGGTPPASAPRASAAPLAAPCTCALRCVLQPRPPCASGSPPGTFPAGPPAACMWWCGHRQRCFWSSARRCPPCAAAPLPRTHIYCRLPCCVCGGVGTGVALLSA